MSSTVAWYPGCSSHASSKEYENSCQALFSRLGVNPVEVTDWNCCGASAAHGVSDELACALALRNLAITEKMGADSVVTPCAACYDRLRHADHTVRESAAMQNRMTELVGSTYGGKIAVRHIVDYLHQVVGLDAIKEKVTRPLTGLKVACYYGCLLVRPPGGAVVDPRMEAPTAMDEVALALGAEIVAWPHKTECCGASAVIPHPESVLRLVHRIVKAAADAGAHCIVAACPLCHGNLDMRQEEAADKHWGSYRMPILYITQLLGLAMGISRDAMGLRMHLVDTAPAERAIID